MRTERISRAWHLFRARDLVDFPHPMCSPETRCYYNIDIGLHPKPPSGQTFPAKGFQIIPPHVTPERSRCLIVTRPIDQLQPPIKSRTFFGI